MRLPEEPDVSPQINIVPMIDVIFALLTFFIMSTLYLSRSTGLPVSLPNASTTESQTKSEIVVTIDQKGQISLNQQSVLLNDLPAQVRTLKGNHQQALVIINADARVSHGQVITVMDQLRSIQGVKLAIAAQPPER
ncbi:biopolymer transporter ExbD [Kovacikia minuta CCNUW1]|uniref:ExbD/TolR family protein n=1 Tax=Kovacikia minuta TaxID=2931930 RepID=UPI001CC9C6C6|nr:biopolymer transporter ExbD [Kovacikia minuta]UBF28347.1 biopolymer transporter ExbD [Kovacikia minuta CCNUW1]